VLGSDLLRSAVGDDLEENRYETFTSDYCVHFVVAFEGGIPAEWRKGLAEVLLPMMVVLEVANVRG